MSMAEALQTNSIHDKPKEGLEQNELILFLSEARTIAEKNQALVDIILISNTANWKSKWYYICWQLIGSWSYELLEFIINHSVQNWCKWWIDIYGRNEPILGSLLKESIKRRDLKAFELLFEAEKNGGEWFTIWIQDFAYEENLEIKTNRKHVRDILKWALKKWLSITEKDIIFATEWWCSFTVCGILLESPQTREILTTDLIAKIRGMERINTEYGKWIRHTLSWLSTRWTVLAAKNPEQWACKIAKPELDKESFKEKLYNKYWVKFERMWDVKALLRTLIINNDERHELLAIIIIHSIQNWCKWWVDLARYKKKPERTLIELAVEYWNFIAFRLLSSLWLFDKIEDAQKILGLAIHSKAWSEKSRKAIYKQMLQSLVWKFTINKQMLTTIINSWNKIFFEVLLENVPDFFSKQKLHDILANTKLLPKNSWAREIINKHLSRLEKQSISQQ